MSAIATIATKAGDVIIPAVALIGQHIYPLTGWYAGSQKPQYPGVYQRDYSGPGEVGVKVRYSYWSGVYWYPSCGTPEQALDEALMPDALWSCWQGLPWRGLTRVVAPGDVA